MTIKVALISTKVTFFDDRCTGTLPRHTTDFPDLLNRLITAMGSEGVLILTAPVAKSLGFPTTPEEAEQDNTEHELAVAARAAGWSVNRIGAWSTFHARKRPTVHVAVRELVADDCPLWARQSGDMVRAFRIWHHLTGRAWAGAPGRVGLEFLRSCDPRPRDEHNRPRPVLWRFDGGPAPDKAYELPLSPGMWQGEPPDAGPHVHGYDLTRAGIAATNVVEVAPWELRYVPKPSPDYRPGTAGWFRIEVPPWNRPEMPHPAGYAHNRDELRWVTTPTILLLEELAAEGVIDKPRIIEAYVGPAKRIFRNYTERLSHVFYEAENLRSKTDREAIQNGVKMSAEQAWGRLNSPEISDWAYRRDWHYAGIAQKRCTVWRRAWLVGHVDNRWPVRFDDDRIDYLAASPYPMQACPASLPLHRDIRSTPRLGSFHIAGNPKQVIAA